MTKHTLMAAAPAALARGHVPLVLAASLLAAPAAAGPAPGSQPAAGGKPAAAAEEIDPSQPTNFYSFIDLNFEWQRFSSGNTYGLRVMPTFALNKRNLMLVELPLMYPDFDGQTNNAFLPGDMRVRYFGLPYMASDPGAVFTAAGLTLDVYIPTGRPEAGTGGGAWSFVPGALIGLQAFAVGDWSLSFYPIVSYNLTTKGAHVVPGGDRPGGGVPPGPEDPNAPEAVISHGIFTQAITVVTFPASLYVQLMPTYSRNFTAGVDSFYLLTLAGWMFHPKMQAVVTFTNEFVNRDQGLNHSLRVGIGYYF